jgi:hypothetical protein
VALNYTQDTVLDTPITFKPILMWLDSLIAKTDIEQLSHTGISESESAAPVKCLPDPSYNLPVWVHPTHSTVYYSTPGPP